MMRACCFAPHADRALFLAATLALAAGACSTMRQRERPPDEVFGNRIQGRDEEGRETLVIVPPDAERSWATYPAVFESITVRPGPFEGGGDPIAVEILVKGAFPDACTELHAVSQERAGNLIDVRLEMRRPQGAMCAAVMRPYRFYLLLDGRYEPGAYTLKLNETAFPFELRRPTVSS